LGAVLRVGVEIVEPRFKPPLIRSKGTVRYQRDTWAAGRRCRGTYRGGRWRSFDSNAGRRTPRYVEPTQYSRRRGGRPRTGRRGRRPRAGKSAGTVRADGSPEWFGRPKLHRATHFRNAACGCHRADRRLLPPKRSQQLGSAAGELVGLAVGDDLVALADRRFPPSVMITSVR
jgi:hypothetical protein